MSDVSVYYFMRRDGADGKGLRSKRRATLETIEDQGTAIMQSKRVVDRTEVDGNGFLIGGEVNDPLDELWPCIRSLELRAAAREKEKLRIAGGPDRDRQAELDSESLELRSQARVLRARLEQAAGGSVRQEASLEATSRTRA
jgi:hypothetical protein